jgi:hypothetical protein
VPSRTGTFRVIAMRLETYMSPLRWASLDSWEKGDPIGQQELKNQIRGFGKNLSGPRNRPLYPFCALVLKGPFEGPKEAFSILQLSWNQKLSWTFVVNNNNTVHGIFSAEFELRACGLHGAVSAADLWAANVVLKDARGGRVWPRF